MGKKTKKNHDNGSRKQEPHQLMGRRLAPLSEEPIAEEDEEGGGGQGSANNSIKKTHHSLLKWLKNSFPLHYSQKKPEPRILLSVLACPLSPISTLPNQSHVLNEKAQYIIRQYWGATAASRKTPVKNTYVLGKVTMAAMGEDHNGMIYSGRFVLWQMIPNMCLLHLTVDGIKISAGTHGEVSWRHTPWHGSHAARGDARPLRRVLQGLDPSIIAAVFTAAGYEGEERIGDEDCFMLKLSVDLATLASRSDDSGEVFLHIMVGYFSQRSGLLIQLKDTQLTRIGFMGSDPVYWETNISSSMEDYRLVDGLMIAHSGRSTVNLVRYGGARKSKNSEEMKQMEETWSIEDVEFNVPGLSSEFFIPPGTVKIIPDDFRKI